MKNREEILFELNALSSSRDFLDVLLIICNSHLNCPAEELATRNLRNVLNESEVTFLFGLWMKNKCLNNAGFIDKQIVAVRVHQLMDEFHLTFLPNLPTFDSSLTYHEQARKNPELIKETIFYSG